VSTNAEKVGGGGGDLPQAPRVFPANYRAFQPTVTDVHYQRYLSGQPAIAISVFVVRRGSLHPSK